MIHQDYLKSYIPHDEEWTPVPKAQGSQGAGKTHTFTNFPHSAADSDEEDDGEKTEFLKEKKNASFWTFEYYQQFFDVETMQVGGRILGSMIPRPGRNYLETHIRPNPDLYGPFWICTTLVFTTAIAGNLANYLQAAGTNYHWAYDFHKVTFAATAIFSYWWVVPFILFGLLWLRGNPERYTFLELICLYGYSLAIYIPISLLWVIPVSWLQWLLVVLGAVLSGSALLLAVWPAVRGDKKQVAMGAMVMIFLLHGALAMGFMLYFFHVPSQAPGNTTTLAPPTTNTTTTLPDHLTSSLLSDPQAHNVPSGAAANQKGGGNQPAQNEAKTGEMGQPPRQNKAAAEQPEVSKPSGKEAEASKASGKEQSGLLGVLQQPGSGSSGTKAPSQKRAVVYRRPHAS
ncbi:hypothetical protein ACOMHN_019566 [Nucella lapillus]